MAADSIQSDLITTATKLRPQIEAYADEAEEARQLPDALVALLREHGLIGMSRPVDLGGSGLDLVSTMRVIEEISVADASTGWCATIGSGSIGTLPLREDVARAVYRRGAYVCGVGAPSGRLVPADGGFRLSGRWAYASGCRHADAIFLGAIVFDGQQPRLTAAGLPDFHLSVLPISEIEILDTWHVSGLRATGSHDVSATDVFVPAERTAAIALGGPPPSDGEYRIPMFTLFGLGLAPVALGAARRAIDELLTMARGGKTPMLSGARLAERPVVQYEVARAEGMLQAGRAYLYGQVGELMRRAARREPIEMDLRARVKLASAQATDFAAQATEIAYRLGGGTSNYEHSPLQRCLRDVHAVTQHFVVAASNYEPVGRVMMGLDPGTPII